MTSLLALEDVGVRHGSRQVIESLSASIGGGELVAIVGPNGAGKTTLLRAAAGLLPATGRIVRSERLAYLPQNGTVAWPMPVRDVVGLGRPARSWRGLPEHADREIVLQVLETCGLRGLANRPATQLSGGELGRVLLARALAARAPLLLFDEPVAALDPAQQIACMDLVRRETLAGRAAVCVLHDLGLVLRYATRVLALAGGRLAADGPPVDILTSGVLDRVFDIHVEPVRSPSGTWLASFGRPGENTLDRSV